jgi:Holliday junction resolvase RusA-like endonuclease
MLNFHVSGVTLDGLDGSKVLQFTILGEPVMKSSPQFWTMAKGKKKVYSNQKDLKEELNRKLKAKLVQLDSNQAIPLFKWKQSKGLEATITIFFNRKVTDWVKQGNNYILRPNSECFPGRKDLENMDKFYLDALHKVVYDNDKITTQIESTKAFNLMQAAGLPRTVICIQEVFA